MKGAVASIAFGPNFQPGVNCANCTACTGVRDVGDFSVSGGATGGKIAKPANVIDNTGINCDRWACPYLANGVTTINLLRQGEMYPSERVNQLDMRVAKILRFRRHRADIGIDVYNVFNTSNTTAFDQNFTYTVTAANPQRFLFPTTIVSPRFARFNLTLGF